MDRDEMLVQAKCLLRLLESPEPGLFTWRLAIGYVLEKLNHRVLCERNDCGWCSAAISRL